NMNYSISNNAEYGEYVTGPEVINDESRAAMRNALKRIQSGEYAKMSIAEGSLGYPSMTAARRTNAAHPTHQGGEKLRAMVPWSASNRIVDKTVDRCRFGVGQTGLRARFVMAQAHEGWLAGGQVCDSACSVCMFRVRSMKDDLLQDSGFEAEGP